MDRWPNAAVIVGRALLPLIDQIRHHDRPLVDQLQRAAQNSYLNLAEGRDARGGNQPARFQTALSECRETRAALNVVVD